MATSKEVELLRYYDLLREYGRHRSEFLAMAQTAYDSVASVVGSAPAREDCSAVLSITLGQSRLWHKLLARKAAKHASHDVSRLLVDIMARYIVDEAFHDMTQNR